VAALTAAARADEQANSDTLRAQVTAALQAYRFQMIVSYPGVAGMFDELPHWLAETGAAPAPGSARFPPHQGADVSQPGVDQHGARD
jgi:hypothetical protein